ncbi:MAG: hypothetical protein M3362_01900 [Acidobacteriota bacterium]|nr:hypothetical protein [Acidobacteriota bacterium]
MPAFGEAVQQFGGFLLIQGLSSGLLWVFREDVCWRKQRLLVKVPVPEENARYAESLYNAGVNRGLGVRLDVLCLLGSRPCCYIWVPSDEEDASYAMLSGLKLSVPTEPVMARAVSNGSLWRAYKWLEGREAFTGIVEQVPRRAG